MSLRTFVHLHEAAGHYVKEKFERPLLGHILRLVFVFAKKVGLFLYTHGARLGWVLFLGVDGPRLRRYKLVQFQVELNSLRFLTATSRPGAS